MKKKSKEEKALAIRIHNIAYDRNKIKAMQIKQRVTLMRAKKLLEEGGTFLDL